MLLQASGGLLILYAINDNLGLFRRQSLWVAIVAWFKSFPRKGKDVTIPLSGLAFVAVAGSASLTTHKDLRTLEERVKYLEETLENHKQEVVAQFLNVQRSLENVKTELHGRVNFVVGQLGELSQKVEQSAVGGFKLQGFGVLLALYGAVTSVFA